jgi:cytosine/adenosine deaminase-related metal-dependent hydrolase
MIIRNARILTFDRQNRILESGAVEVRANGSLGWLGDNQELPESLLQAETLDADGKLLMPALINCHTHLYSSLARGIPLQGAAPRNFIEILKKLWWKLDAALEEEDVYLSAMVGLIDWQPGPPRKRVSGGRTRRVPLLRDQRPKRASEGQ